MRALRQWWARLASLWRGASRDRELAEELRFHLQADAAEMEAEGATPDDAARKARRAMGNSTLIHEQTREVWRWNALERLGQDIKYAWRVAGRRPLFTAIAVLSLALGTGANTAVYSLIDAVLLEKLPIARPDDLVQLNRVGGGGASPAEYSALRTSSRQLSGVAGVGMAAARPIEIFDEGTRRDVFVHTVTDTYFELLGVPALRGRVFTPRAASEPPQNLAVISERYWRERYAGDPRVVGARFQLGPRRIEFTIIGVATAGFDGVHVDIPADLWLSSPVFAGPVRMMGRLAPGATLGSAEREINALITRPMKVVSVARGYSSVRAQLERPLVLLELLVAAVFLITCANLANLTLAASAARARELAMRRAIGASRWRVVQQLTVECLLLAVAGAAGGWALAGSISAALLTFLPFDQTRAGLAFRFEPDASVFGFTLLLCAVTTIVCGLLPALRATRAAAGAVMKSGAGGGGQRSWTSRSLIVGQVAMCALLLAVAGMFLRTITNLRSQHTGFVEDGVLVADVHPPFEYGEARRDVLLEELRARAAGIQGVTLVSFGHSGQLSGNTFDYRVWNPRTRTAASPDAMAVEERVAPGYLGAIGTRLVAGRDISDDDRAGGEAVAVVNQTFVRQFGIEAPAVGRQFAAQRYERTVWIRIVGVVEDAKWVTLREAPQPIYYRPYAQEAGHPQVRFVLRGTGDLGTLAGAFAHVAQSVDRGIVLRNVMPFRDVVNRTMAIERLVAQVSAWMAGLGLLVASIGLYGVLAYAVERRRREIGVRLAVGASPGAVERMMLRESWVLVVAGLLLGVPVAMLVLRSAAHLLFGVTPVDPITMTAVTAALVVTTTLGAYIPARRAAAIDPAVVLKEE
jgi:putative ABC transport system permease protein